MTRLGEGRGALKGQVCIQGSRLAALGLLWENEDFGPFSPDQPLTLAVPPL